MKQEIQLPNLVINWGLNLNKGSCSISLSDLQIRS